MNKYATVYNSMLNKLAAGEAGIGGFALGATAPYIPRTRIPQQPRVGGTLGSIAGSVSQGPSTPTAAPAPNTIPAGSGSFSSQTDWGRYNPLLRGNSLLEQERKEEERRRLEEEERLRRPMPWYPGKKHKSFKDLTSDDIQKEYEERMEAPLYTKGRIPLPKPNIGELMRKFNIGKYHQPQSK